MSVEADIRARLDRIDAENPKLNAFIRVDREEALAAARAADRRPARLGSLDGLPVAVKDNIAVAGKPLTAGIAGRRDAIAEVDAGAVTRLKAAGAVVLGGLNMHEAALGGTTDNAAFGRCGNPLGQGFGQGFGRGFGPALTPGGSSGGSAAAVAAGLVDIALGSDTMGSVRLPAAYCGVSGIKPTPGLIGRSGFVYLSRSLDTIGPLARDPALLWPALAALAGPDPDDPESEVPPPGWRDRPWRDTLHGLRFAIPAQLAAVDCEPAVLEAFETAKRTVADLGATLADIDLPTWDPGRARLSGLILVEAEGAVELADLIDRPGAMTPTLHAMLDFGRRVAPGRLVRAQAAIRAAGAACRRALAGVDGILMPTAPQLPFPHDAPAPVTQADLTALANFARCPALALPVARDGLPGSVQIVSAPWTEAALTRWGEILAPALNP